MSKRETVRGYDDEFLDCRDLRHPWELVGFYRQDGVIRRILACTRCGTERNDRWQTDGQRKPSSYNYVEGYKVEGGFNTFEVRREVIRRARIYPSMEAMVGALASAGKPKVRRTKKK